jgi:small-conductance mechanosensitive channel
MPLQSDSSGNYPVFYTEEMKKIVQNNPKISIEDAEKEADKKARERDVVYKQDPIFYRWLLLGLVLIVIIVVIGSILLIAIGQKPSDGIIAIGSGAVGALIGLFSNK